MRISDWSSDVCSSDLAGVLPVAERAGMVEMQVRHDHVLNLARADAERLQPFARQAVERAAARRGGLLRHAGVDQDGPAVATDQRSEEHTSELQSLMRISYAVFCLKKKKNT